MPKKGSQAPAPSAQASSPSVTATTPATEATESEQTPAFYTSFGEFIYKRMRALNKRKTRITKLEEDVKAGKKLDPEQVESLSKKFEVTLLLKEYEELRRAFVPVEAELVAARKQMGTVQEALEILEGRAAANAVEHSRQITQLFALLDHVRHARDAYAEENTDLLHILSEFDSLLRPNAGSLAQALESSSSALRKYLAGDEDIAVGKMSYRDLAAAVNDLIAEGPMTRTVIEAPSAGVQIEILEPSPQALQNAAAEIVHDLVTGQVTAADAAQALTEMNEAAEAAHQDVNDIIEQVQEVVAVQNELTAAIQDLIDTQQAVEEPSAAEPEQPVEFVFLTNSIVENLAAQAAAEQAAAQAQAQAAAEAIVAAIAAAEASPAPEPATILLVAAPAAAPVAPAAAVATPVSAPAAAAPVFGYARAASANTPHAFTHTQSSSNVSTASVAGSPAPPAVTPIPAEGTQHKGRGSQRGSRGRSGQPQGAGEGRPPRPRSQRPQQEQQQQEDSLEADGFTAVRTSRPPARVTTYRGRGNGRGQPRGNAPTLA